MSEKQTNTPNEILPIIKNIDEIFILRQIIADKDKYICYLERQVKLLKTELRELAITEHKKRRDDIKDLLKKCVIRLNQKRKELIDE